MTARILLHLTAERLDVWYWRRGRLSPGPGFTADPAGQAGFAAWIATCADIPVRLLVDGSDEAFALESLPRIHGRDGRALLARRQQQIAHDSPYTCRLDLGREPEGRRDWRMLFLSLGRPARLDPWLHALNAAGAPLSDICIPAQVLAEALPRAQRRTAQVLLLTRGPAGLRQTLFERGRPRFSRLLPGNPEAAPWPSNLTSELRRTAHYGLSQRMLSRQEPLLVLMCASSETVAQLGQEFVEADPLALRFERLATEESDHPSPDLALLLECTARWRGAQLAPASSTATFRRQRLERGARWAAVLGATLLFAWSWQLLADGRALREQEVGLSQRNRETQAQLDQLRTTLPPLPAALEEVETRLVRAQELEALARLPADAVRQLSRVLARHPEITLSQLEWQLATEELANPGQSSHPQRGLHLQLHGHWQAGSVSALTLEKLARELREAGASKVELDRSASTPATTEDGVRPLTVIAEFNGAPS